MKHTAPATPLPQAHGAPSYTPFSLSDNMTLLQCLSSAPRPWRAHGAYGEHWWLLLDNAPVAYCKTITYPGEDEGFVLSDIEVKSSHKRQGLARLLTTSASEVKGEVLYSTGNWTEEGAKALHFLPLASGFEPGVFYREQAFVKNWDTKELRYF